MPAFTEMGTPSTSVENDCFATKISPLPAELRAAIGAASFWFGGAAAPGSGCDRSRCCGRSDGSGDEQGPERVGVQHLRRVPPEREEPTLAGREAVRSAEQVRDQLDVHPDPVDDLEVPPVAEDRDL